MARIRLRRLMSKAKTSRINRTHPSAPVDVTAYCRDLANWPRSWMGVEKDLPPGEALIACFRPFIEHLATTGLSAKTIRRHVDNLWSVGGEIIRDLHYDPSLRKRPTDQLLRNAVHQYGGPAVHNGSEEQQRSVDSTCRKLHRFLIQPRA
jgi:hypothetical protein